MKKSNFLKIGVAACAIAFGAISFAHPTTKTANQQASLKLRDLTRVSNANADGTITCGDAASPCTVTYNGTPNTQVQGHKQP